MKKVILGLTVLLSVAAMAKSKDDMIEKEMLTKFPSLTDGVTTMNVHKYDVDVHKKSSELKVEFKGNDKELKAEYDKMNKAKVEEVASQMAQYVQTEAKNTNPVKVKIEIDRDALPDEVLYENTFAK